MNTYFKTLTALLLALIVYGTAYAQNSYEAAMGTALQSLSQAKQPNDFATLANRFEQISNTVTDQWTPLYYAAYCQLVAGISQQQPANKDSYFDKALQLVANADTRASENSEIYALKGYALFMKMSVDPQNRLDLIGQAEAALDHATKLDPMNPRPYFIKGQNTFYTPVFFGGGAKAARPLLEQAKTLFDTFEPAGIFAPDWGKEQCAYLLQQAGKAQ